ncbi:Serine carboxypeptidase-like 35 [Ranunculus cassubicifolius]
MTISVSWFLQLLVFTLSCSSILARIQSAPKVSGELSRPESDLVTNLPGQPAVNFKHFAGYVKLRKEDEKALFYWFFEAQDHVAERPIVLWLNGGPGCSSVAYGAAQELGPFLARNNDSNLVLNKFSWNKAANLLFLEAPVGVGYSYTNNSADLNNLGDKVTAEDSHAFLVEWFKKFPKFKSHEFYIAGESYAGHYVPQLAELVYDRNKGASKDTVINFKGFMIGNAVLNDDTDELGIFEFAWSHAIISDQIYHSITSNCDFRKYNQTTICKLSIHNFSQAYQDINMYSIYSPVCVRSKDTTITRPKLRSSAWTLTKHDLWRTLPTGYDPCAGDYAVKYFNRKDVQNALHANVTKLNYPYTPCSSQIPRWTDYANSTLPQIKKLLNAGLRIWVYSGDTDGRVPITSTRNSINVMKSKVKDEWRSWFHRDQVAGWVTTYENGLTLATVRGAGHQVPQFAPAQSLTLFSHFLSGSPLPATRF